MSTETIFTVIMVILIADYLIDRTLDILNARRWSDKLPKRLVGIYDEDKYRESQKYEKAKYYLGLFVSGLSFVVMLIMFLSGGFGLLDDYLRQYTEHPILLAFLYFAVLGLAADILGTPFELYSTFVVEEKFGFNKTTPKIYILDKLKSWLLSILLGAPILALIIYIYESTGNDFWLLVWGVLTAFMIFMTMFYSNIIVPLFNKQTPLEDGDLRNAIEDFAVKVGFKLQNIYVIDGSKRSTKANAYFTGLGMKKRIVLYDTLIKDHTVEELVAVLAHEIGHYKKKHTLSSVGLSILQSGLMLYILSLFIAKDSQLALSLAEALGATNASFHLGILAFGILYSPISMVLGLLLNVLSRKNEYEADRFAGENYKPEALQLALKKLSVNHLSNLNPHPAYVFFYYSHPSLLQRLAALDKVK